MCELNGIEFFGVRIQCNPTAPSSQWEVKSRDKRSGRFHGCHDRFAHPLGSGLRACREAAEQINSIVNSRSETDCWILSPIRGGESPFVSNEISETDH